MTVRMKINTVRQKINSENSHRPDILTECFSINLNFVINFCDNFSKKI